VDLPLALHCHATTGLSLPTHMKAIDAGIDILDTAISTMSMTYGHSPTETVVAMVEDSVHTTGLDLLLLEEIATYFRDVRKKYAQFEGAMRGVDSRILLAQVPGGMLTNMEAQLKEQGAADRLDEVLLEIPKVRADLGYIPLVTPTSQIVGTQAVLNVLAGERYKNITKETAAILKGEYGAAPAPLNAELQARVLNGEAAITCRPADLLPPEWDRVGAELFKAAEQTGIDAASLNDDDRLTYALFPQVALKFFSHRDDPSFFEPQPGLPLSAASSECGAMVATAPAPCSGAASYDVRVDGVVYHVEVAPSGELMSVNAQAVQPSSAPRPVSLAAPSGVSFPAPLAGTIVKLVAATGSEVQEGDVILVMEAMKMEAEIRAPHAGVLSRYQVQPGELVAQGSTLAWFV
jgi:oxaloacetate decarboxylase (Na+ extruding) subunit alpha